MKLCLFRRNWIATIWLDSIYKKILFQVSIDALVSWRRCFALWVFIHQNPIGSLSIIDENFCSIQFFFMHGRTKDKFAFNARFLVSESSFECLCTLFVPRISRGPFCSKRAYLHWETWKKYEYLGNRLLLRMTTWLFKRLISICQFALETLFKTNVNN